MVRQKRHCFHYTFLMKYKAKLAVGSRDFDQEYLSVCASYLIAMHGLPVAAGSGRSGNQVLLRAGNFAVIFDAGIIWHRYF